MKWKEEYATEQIEWTPIDYFNNKIVCELIESKRPPGIFSVLDDVCATLHAVSTGADLDLQKKLNNAARHHKHYEEGKDSFVIHHYAGKVCYDVDGFCDKNRDVLFPDLVQLMQSSTSPFVKKLFEKDVGIQSKSRPTTAGSKILTQANALVDRLSNCRPHYVRCIKPNETKRPKDWNDQSVRHQVEYLGLKENIRMRRAGFAYRRPFGKFLYRYGILMKGTGWQGDEKSGVEMIMKKLNVHLGLYELGLTKVFIKAPETLFMLEEQRERKYNYYARVIQKAFKKYFAHRQYDKHKMEAANLVSGKKERRQNSLNRNFVGDYIGLDNRIMTPNLIGRREKICFAEVVKKYDRNFKTTRRDLILTWSVLYLIGREKVKKGKNKGAYQEVIKRKVELDRVNDVSLSTLRDDLVVIHVKDSYDSLLEIMFKTEFLYCLSKSYYAKMGRNLNIIFSNKLEFKVKKEGWGGGGTRYVNFVCDERSQAPDETFKSSGKVLTVTVPKGLPNTSLPSRKKSSSQKQTKISGERIPKGLGHVATSNGPGALGYRRVAPPPPSEPAPPNQPLISSFRFNYQRLNQGKLKETDARSTDRGTKGNKSQVEKPVPGGGKPRPPVKPKPITLPRCKAIYDYMAQDLDELSFEPGDVIDIIKEHEGGWWQGRLRGKEGLFPSNYVEKM
ncbi:hypothetical protein RUM44_011443 [Polyplax serrata]|uniref:Uncharacterized protein n=1 Tax=Polyplax serrata TaxID=468196 RepID=A0ABR1AQD6_POLSC